MAERGIESYQANDYEKAADAFEQALSICEHPALRDLQPDFIDQLYAYAGNSHIHLGQYDKAEALILQAVHLSDPQLHPELKDEHQIHLLSLAYLYLETHRFDEAQKILLSPALKQSIERIDPQQLTVYYNSVAQLFFRTGQYEKAHIFFDKAIALEKNEVDNAVMLNNKGWVFSLQCLYDSAIVYFTRAQNQYKKNPLFHQAHKTYFAKNLNGWGWLKTQLQEYDEAIAFFKQALALTDSSHDDYPRFLFNLANAYAQKGESQEALKYFLQSLNIYRKYLLKYYPYLSEEQKINYFSALHLKFERFYSFLFLEYLKDKNLPPYLTEYLYNLQISTKGLLYSPNKKWLLSIASKSKTKNLALLRKWQKLQIAFQKARKQNNIAAIDSILNEFQKVEKQVFQLDALSQKALKNELNYQAIQRRLTSRSAAIEIIRFRNYNKVASPYATNCIQEGFGDSSYYAALILKNIGPPSYLLLPESPLFETIYYPHYSSQMNIIQNDSLLSETHRDTLSFQKFWQPIQNYLKGIDTVFIAPEGIYNHINIQTLQLPSGKYLVDSLEVHVVTNTRDILKDKKPSLESSAYPPILILIFIICLFLTSIVAFIVYYKYQKEYWLLLGFITLIWALILTFIPRTPKSVFLGFADHNAPISKIVSPKVPNAVRQAQTIFKPQLQKFIRKIKNPKLLEASRLEIENSSSIMSGYGLGKGYPTTEFIGAAAQKSTLWQLQNPWILHIATHGFYFSDSTPNRIDFSCLDDVFSSSLFHLYRSGLVFAGDIETFQDPLQYWEQCILTAYEAMHLNLAQTELVVLSACESGLGDYKSSFAVHGLPGAFKAAGVQNVIVSLRPVYDKTTSEFMTTFYKAWQKEVSQYQAFRLAQNEIRKKMPHPANWGALVLVE
ncbi:MAG: CHAT domain-containing protein [Bacteroidia bacterium]|nr:CHAT domain-containing protein [Bacteroidia bacterium]